MKEQLALFGGKPLVKKRIPPCMSTIGKDEIGAAAKALAERKLSVFSSGRIADFERRFSEYEKTKCAVATNSGTAALHVALAALGIGRGDEVIVPDYTYAATAMSVLHQGAKPVFADIDKNTYNISIDSIKRMRTGKTKAIVVVHLFGQPADMGPICELAEKHGLAVIEDCAHATGAKWRNKKVGSIGTLGCFSFQETKNITTGGEGGMLTTSDETLAERARLIVHEGETCADGKTSARTSDCPLPYDYVCLGYNYRMSAVQAAIGIEQLKKLDSLNRKRIEHAKYYYRALRRFQDLSLPVTIKGVQHVFSEFVLKLRPRAGYPRDLFLMALNAEGIPAIKYYATPLDETTIFRRMGKVVRNAYPGAKEACESQIVLPTYPDLSERNLKDIVEGIEKVSGGLKGYEIR